MGTIRKTSSGVYINDESRPVRVEKGSWHTVLKCVGDAARAFSLTSQQVHTAADMKSPINGLSFSWPSLAKVRGEWPDYRVVDNRQLAAKPCTVVYKTPGRHSRTYTIDVRSIRATRKALNLTERQFEIVANKLPGWRNVAPECVESIVVQAPGYTPTNPVSSGVGCRRFFVMRQLAGGMKMELANGHPQTFGHISDVPEFVLNNCEWR